MQEEWLVKGYRMQQLEEKSRFRADYLRSGVLKFGYLSQRDAINATSPETDHKGEIMVPACCNEYPTRCSRWFSAKRWRGPPNYVLRTLSSPCYCP
jgi:hypothetical protein